MGYQWHTWLTYVGTDDPVSQIEKYFYGAEQLRKAKYDGIFHPGVVTTSMQHKSRQHLV